MVDLVAIAYADARTAMEAEREAQRLADVLAIRPDAVAAVVREVDGTVRVTTSHHRVEAGDTYGMLWTPLFAMLFFVPVFGMAVGAGLGALMGTLERAGIEERFQKQARELLQPGTSALFLVLEERTPEQTRQVLHRFDGTLLTTRLSKDAVQQIQSELHGSTPKQPVGA
jgi:uncharacterized membrane protein